MVSGLVPEAETTRTLHGRRSSLAVGSKVKAVDRSDRPLVLTQRRCSREADSGVNDGGNPRPGGPPRLVF